MVQIVVDQNLVAACGLYCGACRKFTKGKCQGCAKNEKATWCTVRSCIITHQIKSCAECKEFSDPMQCKKFNNPMSKIFGFVFRSDRAACIAQIKRLGLEGHAQNMAETKRQTIRR